MAFIFYSISLILFIFILPIMVYLVAYNDSGQYSTSQEIPSDVLIMYLIFSTIVVVFYLIVILRIVIKEKAKYYKEIDNSDI